MALSDQERRLLEQLEASLMADDPKFANTLSGDSYVRVEKRRATLAGLGFLLGVATLLFGMEVHLVVSIAGFIIMLAAAIVGVSAWKRVSVVETEPDIRQSRHSNRGQDFLDQLDDRQRRGHDDDSAS